ncbi:hypothetical protein GUITHDRAFT_152017 [Guillardia theta CCMP2712]|uniref:Uncharacterized protein n=1 Tax=Guillardia theta (strain CCMP2712) TaxID=905079 RepID=L1JHB5_GUITC|nr:hypothetical protein GUITHDRAFT_152017 [Guillardia theta CCMP2712]EKX47529.1 hypothetical protein GUITHDRAFT_152017 [Guillardia theta CCMP2712]|eukprot:XP_005834509.1 hypothetical protein GUITHDRAFT_152017 [Guillardia theta CCMP2712]
MTKHCRIPSRDSQQMSSIPEIQKVFKKRSAQIRRVFLSYSQEDTEDLEDGKDETMNLKELYQFMKDSQQMDSKFGISKLASCFVTANSVVAGSSSGGDDGTWNDWDWELEYDEFLEVIVRIVDLKTKTAEGQLADKVDKFLSDCFAANTYN